MRAVDHHADPVHFRHDLAPEVGEPDVFIVAAAAGEVVTVVGEQHLTDAKAIVEVDHADVAVEGVHALKIERDRELALAARAVDVVDRLDLDQHLGMGADPMAILRGRLERERPGHYVVACIDR